MTAHLTLTAAAVAALAFLTTTGAQAQAVKVGTFYNTGMNNTQTVLGNNAPETHYTIVSTPNGSTPSVRVATSANGFPIPPWVGDDTVSAWIGPNTDSALNDAAGRYDYRTTFDLTGFDVSTAALNGLWAADDTGVNILINGISTKQPGGSYGAFTSFTVASGFIDGVNTIDFLVTNAGNDSNPTGLRVEGTLTATFVPEPMSLAILGVSLAGVGLFRRFNQA